MKRRSHLAFWKAREKARAIGLRRKCPVVWPALQEEEEGKSFFMLRFLSSFLIMK